MAKRRMISQTIIYDENFNLLSIEAQNIFIRMLSVSDDFGIVPANEYTLRTLINPPPKITNKIIPLMQEIIEREMGILFNYNGKAWFMFKPSSFEEINSYVLNKRTKSEYLKLTKEEILSENFQELLRNSTEPLPTSIESIKIKDISNKIKEESKKKEFAEYVLMTDEEHEKLLTEHGQELTDKFIETLNNYKGSTGKKYKSDYLAILNWVIKRVKEEINGTTKNNTSKGSVKSRTDYRFDPVKAEKRLSQLEEQFGK